MPFTSREESIQSLREIRGGSKQHEAKTRAAGGGRRSPRTPASFLKGTHRRLKAVNLLGVLQKPYLGVNVTSKAARSPSFTVATANGASTNSASLPSSVRTITLPLFRSTFLTTPVTA